MKRKKRAPRQQQSRYASVLVVVAVAGVALISALYWTSRSDGPASSSPPGTNSKSDVPPFFASAEAAVPLPKTLSADLFSQPYVARAYRAAERIPSVLAQQPCYCHCDEVGHRSLLDCFTTKHGAG